MLVWNKIYPPKDASKIILVWGWSPSQNICTCISTSNSWLGHFFNWTLNLSQASHNDSSIPWVAIKAFDVVLLKGGTDGMRPTQAKEKKKTKS